MDENIRRLGTLGMAGNAAAAEAFARLVSRTTGEPTPEDIREAIGPLLKKLSELNVKVCEEQDKELGLDFSDIIAACGHSADYGLEPGFLVSPLCHSSCSFAETGLPNLWISKEGLRGLGEKSITLYVCPEHNRQTIEDFGSGGFFVIPRTNRSLFLTIPMYDDNSQRYPGNIQPGYYSRREFVDLMRKFQFDPEVICFLADMME